LLLIEGERERKEVAIVEVCSVRSDEMKKLSIIRKTMWPSRLSESLECFQYWASISDHGLRILGAQLELDKLSPSLKNLEL